ncbi:O-antigen ligase family protein [Luteirhabdus pelagi]|uniref:O-antigen ligase family protein n=1 Tax=Luteirhabdus pelagi TaxID=2792783 RepID=UPI00193A5768|nr:O-antigen ligase family protein [Luteirhabdus pelagi]
MSSIFRFKNIIHALLFCFVTLVILNSIKPFIVVTLIGSIGKFAVAILGCIALVLFLSRNRFNTQFSLWIPYAIVGFLIMLFAALFSLSNNTNENLLYNASVIIYLLFYFWLVKAATGLNFETFGFESFEITKIRLLKTFRWALSLNVLVWFTVAFATGIDMTDMDGFGGFFQDKIHFGLLAACGFLLGFYLWRHPLSRDTSIWNYLQMLIYLALAVVTSRNAVIIAITAVVFYFLIARIRTRLYAVILLIAPIFLFYVNDLFSIFPTERLNKLSTGRFEIWRLAWEGIYDKGLLLGSGIFNLNDSVLQENVGTGFYYLDTLDFLYFHSSYLEIVAAGGIIVLLLFLYILWKSLQSMSRIDKSVIVAIAIGGLVESYLVQPFMLISILFYLLLFANTLKLKVKKQTDNNLEKKT